MRVEQIRMRRTVLLPVAALALTSAALALPGQAAAARTHVLRPAVTVGPDGNEPLVRVGPNGQVYVSALQHLYASGNRGRTFQGGLGSIYSTTLNQNSDSSIGIDEPFPFQFHGTATGVDLRRVPDSVPVPHVESVPLVFPRLIDPLLLPNMPGAPSGALPASQREPELIVVVPV